MCHNDRVVTHANASARMGENGRIVLPVELGKAMDLQGGQELMLALHEDGLHIQIFRQSIERA